MRRVAVGWSFIDFEDECGFGKNATLEVSLWFDHGEQIELSEILFKRIETHDSRTIYSHRDHAAGRVAASQWAVMTDFVVKKCMAMAFVFEPIVLAADPVHDVDYEG